MRSTSKILTTTALTIGLLAPMAASQAQVAIPEAPAIAAAVTQGSGGSYTDKTFQSYTAAGKTGQYHVYASGIDRSKPVGVVFQFHGDGGYEFKNPSYKLPGLNKAAKEHNMIFVSMKAPNSQNVWWNDIEKNGDYARSLIQNEVMNKYNIDKDRVWMVGYSGGAEFISYEMLQEQNDLFTGGGAIMFGGGGAPSSFERQPSASLKKNFQLTWHTGLDDGMGNSDAGWSALATAREGQAFYKKSGFTNTSLQTPAGIDHFEYDEPGAFRKELTRWEGAGTTTPTTPTTPTKPTTPTTPSTPTVKGGIGAKYYSLGGAAKLGKPVSAEKAIAGGVVQTFKTSAGKVTDIYWSSSTGAQSVTGNIKTKLDRLGIARTGFPKNEATSVYRNTTLQSFQKGTIRVKYGYTTWIAR